MENNKLFVYGILKRGYELDLSQYGATFLGEAEIPNATLYGIGPIRMADNLDEGPQMYHGVGLRLDEGPNGVALGAKGELWEIPDNLWKWLDQIENNGLVYTRKIVPVKVEIASDLYGRCMYCNQDGYTNDDEYGNGCNCPEGPCCGRCKEGLLAWVFEHTYPRFNYNNPIEGGNF